MTRLSGKKALDEMAGELGGLDIFVSSAALPTTSFTKRRAETLKLVRTTRLDEGIVQLHYRRR